jgi:hypothetical protein
MTRHKRSLADVVKENREAEKCLLCTIPEREEIERERFTNGAEVRHICEYLIKDCGYPEDEINRQRSSKMSKHFKYHCEKWLTTRS